MRYPLPLSGIAFLALWSVSTFGEHVFGSYAFGIDANAQSENQPGGTSSNPLQAQSLDRLSATRDRPLFSPTRRPVPPPPPPVEREPEVAAPSPPPSVTVVGIVIDGEGARAIVRSGMGTKLDRVQIGDDVGGWKVSQIEARRLVLSLDGRLATFTLFSDERGNRPPDDSGSKVQAGPQSADSPAPTRKRRKSRE